MKTEWFMYLGFVLGAVTAILFVVGQSTLGVVSGILTGLAWTLYGVREKSKA